MRLRKIAGMLFLFGQVATPSFAQQTAGQLPPNVSSPLSAGTNTNYGKLAAVFEANQGQTDPQVKFLFRGRGYSAFLTSGSMVLSLRPTSIVPIPPTGKVHITENAVPASTPTMQFRLSGASESPEVLGEDRKPGKVNYFIGRDPKKWHTNVPTYARVRYKNVYPGIDLVYYGSGRQMECDFAVSPGANPNRIQFEITGAGEIRIDTAGNLLLKTDSGELRFESPVVYQESHGQRVVVDGGYVVDDPTHISFHVAHYDSAKPLVIDPVLVYSTYLGGSGTDQPAGIAVDSTGSVYIAGYTNSPNFPLAALGSLPTGEDHVFVAKLDPTGSNLIYADYIGGSNQDFGYALALDSTNEVYVTGSTESTDFPVVNPYQSSLPGYYSGFVTKISANGSSLLYSTYLGGNAYDQPSGIGIDSTGEAYVAGFTSSLNFPVMNAYQSTVSPNQGGFFGAAGFVSKFSADGSSLVYSTFLSGSSNVSTCNQGTCWPRPYNLIYGIAVDSNDNAYVAGQTNTYNFPATQDAYLTTNSAPLNTMIGFVTKFSSSGGLAYSTYLYGASGSATQIAAIAVDGSGSAYVTGTALSDGTFPITSTSICDPSVSFGGCSYAFVTKFDPSGSTLLYSTFLGPYNIAFPQAIVLDRNNDAYVLCRTSSTSFAIQNGIEGYTSQDDLLVAEIDPAASTELFATYLGGSGGAYPAGIAVDSSGNIYVGGQTFATDFPVTSAAFQDTLAGNANAFVMKIGPGAAPSVSVSPVSLQFAQESLGGTSSPQTAILRNMGSSPLSISSTTISGDFAETDTCENSVPAASSCTFSVTFTPTAAGPRSGSILIQDNAAGSPHVISLSGNGPGPIVVLTPASLMFSAQQLGTSSTAQVVTLANSGNVALSINSIQAGGDFAQTNTCPATLAASASCTISVIFTPTVSGTRSGILTISDTALDSPQVVNITGTGSTAPAPIATVTPTSLTFQIQQLGTSSPVQTVTLTDTGNAALNIDGIQLTGDFAQINNCPATLAPNASCTINITFAPTATGARTGILTISDNAQGSPQTLNLSGTGSASSVPIATVTPTSLVFSDQQVGTASAARTVTLTNSGSAALKISSIQSSADYTQTNTCPATLAASSACTVTVKFTPTASGTRNGTLNISDNALGSPQVVNLVGAGADFSLTGSPSSETLKAGGTATYQMTISPLGGLFTNVVTLSCSGAPALTTCRVSPNTVTPNGSSATSTLTIITTASVAHASSLGSIRDSTIYAMCMPGGLGLFGMILIGSRKRSRRLRVIILPVLLSGALIYMSGCAGGTGIISPPQSGTTLGTYTVTVTGASGAMKHSLPVTLVVQ
jgi:Beta-propeller repeat/Abnormal spindle-like microcephaly-assoc'd, ASPM-SPD-2-Hydin